VGAGCHVGTAAAPALVKVVKEVPYKWRDDTPSPSLSFPNSLHKFCPK